jgi:ribonuclease HI
MIAMLVMQDVKGAYNGVPREIIADKLASQGIPANVVE